MTHSVEEAIYFADRVVVMSENPGRIRSVIPITLPRPRDIEDEHFTSLRKQILSQVQLSVKQSVKDEYDSEEAAL